jgi:putative ABC transport system substrate-binding protein
MANPGGNTMGVSIFATQLDGKRQEILIEMMPGLRRMAALADIHTTGPRQLQALQDAAVRRRRQTSRSSAPRSHVNAAQ